MAKHRTYSIEFKRQVAQEYLGGETLHGLARRHDVSRNLIRIWVSKLEAGGVFGHVGRGWANGREAGTAGSNASSW